ncbi:hypothetical protein Ocin01_15300 [Orchesella cincta]|uniref:Uncharacterized protein n=1 Tax=Orchesella cincta TaxID=48709 RepID=A0A1D2MEE1_ORCCI|nr:hypothetical protein Ocin01_15300 [Orchesella cincta]
MCHKISKHNKHWPTTWICVVVCIIATLFITGCVCDEENSMPSEEMHEEEPEKKKKILDWATAVIGAGGKTLGEFIRDYEVHVLYEFVFIFFQWAFFFYAGLLI